MTMRLNRRAVLSGAAGLGAAPAAAFGETPHMTYDASIRGFLEGLIAPGPHPSLGRHAHTYGRLIGSWAGEYEDHDDDGSVERGEMEVHFAWVLQGLAVQDLWIAPSRAQRAAGELSSKRNTYGSTLRVFDPEHELWRVVWLSPARNARNDLVGRQIGEAVVQTGYFNDAPIKWVFTRITQSAFTWQAHTLERDGVTWRLGTEFRLRRTA